MAKKHEFISVSGDDGVYAGIVSGIIIAKFGYKLTSKQQKIFHLWKIDEEKVDSRIQAIDV